MPFINLERDDAETDAPDEEEDEPSYMHQPPTPLPLFHPPPPPLSFLPSSSFPSPPPIVAPPTCLLSLSAGPSLPAMGLCTLQREPPGGGEAATGKEEERAVPAWDVRDRWEWRRRTGSGERGLARG